MDAAKTSLKADTPGFGDRDVFIFGVFVKKKEIREKRWDSIALLFSATKFCAARA